MSGKKILLGLDGSVQSRYAAELAWALAKAGKMQVEAQHVVDSLASWDFLSFDIAGFIGSGPYFEAHEMMRDTLQSLGENLIEVYRNLAKDNGIEGEAFLDEGTTIREICIRAKDCQIVVLGQHSTGMNSPVEDQRKLPRRSIAESLTHYCPRPLLVIQDRCEPWKTMRIMSSPHETQTDLIRSCVKWGQSVNIEPTVRVLHTDCEQPATDAKTASDGLKATQDLTKALPELKGKKVDVRTTSDLNEYWKSDAEENEHILLVIPVTEVNGVRLTPFGTTPDVMVRYLNHPAILFWMESSATDQVPEAQKSVSGAV